MGNGIQPPNYTQIPNALLGDLKKGNVTEPGLMSEMAGSELKVYLAVCRLTFGFHQLRRRASIKMIMKFTGMAKQSVYNASEKLEEKGLIERQKDGGVTLWKAIVYYLDPPTGDNYVNLESKNKTGESKNKTPNGLKIRHPSKKETLEINKEDKELILFQHFLKISKKRGPKSDMARDEWFEDCKDILDLAGGDVDSAKELMTQARLDCIEASYSFAKPGGLINWITGILEKEEVEAKKKSKTWHDGYEFAEVELSTTPTAPDDSELQQIRAIAGMQFQFLAQARQGERNNGTLVLEFPPAAYEMARYHKATLEVWLAGWMIEENISTLEFELIE